MKVATWLVVSCCAFGACDLGPGDRASPPDAEAMPNGETHILESVSELLTLPVGQGVSPASGYAPAGSATTYTRGDDQTIRIANGPWCVPITVPVGTKVQGFAVALQDGGSSVNVIKVEIVSSIAGVLGGITTQGTGLEQAWTTSWPSTVRTTVGGEMLWFRLSPLTTSGAWTTVNSTIESLSLWSPSPAVTTIPLAGSAFVAATPAVHPVDYEFGTVLGPSFEVRGNVPVPVGHQIVAVRAVVQDSATDQNAKMQVQLICINSNNTNVLAGSPVSNGSGNVQTLTIMTSTTVQPNTACHLRVYALAQPSASVTLWFAQVDYN